MKIFNKTLITTGALFIASAGALAPAQAASVETWDALAQCESGGNWNTSTGNGFSGGLQFTPSTWAAFGGSGNPANASKSEQIRVAENVLVGQGWGAWPSCSANLGLYGNSGSIASTQTPAPSVVTPQSETAPVEIAQPVVVEEAVSPVEAPFEAPIVEDTSAFVGSPVAVGETVVGESNYTVKKGDTLSQIAINNNVDGGWEKLAEMNADIIPNPHAIEVGQVIQLP